MDKLLYLLLFVFSMCIFSSSESFILKNPTKHTYLSCYVKTPLRFENIKDLEIIDEKGNIIPYQFEKDINSNAYNLWILDDFPLGIQKKYKIFQKKCEIKDRIYIKETKDFIIIDNGKIGITIPLLINKKDGPIKEIRLNNKFFGESSWNEEVKNYKIEILSKGPIFFKIKQKFEFENGEFSEITITIFAEKPYVIIEEKHHDYFKRYWELNLFKNKIAEGYIYGWFTTEGDKIGPSPHPPLKEDIERKYIAPFLYEKLRKINFSLLSDKTITFLEPRWTQNFEKSWFFGFSDGQDFIGIIPAKAGKWLYPYDNSIEVKVKKEGIGCFVFPTYKGSRYYYLIAEKNEFLENIKDFTQWEILFPLHEILDKYFIDWENKTGNFEPRFYFSDGISNPTGATRGMGRNLISDIRKGKLPTENINTLTLFQQYIDPDFWGYPYNGWSPINPNFYTDFIRIPVALLTGLKTHPSYLIFLNHIKKLLDYHLSSTIIMPKGAGTECPGYLWHALTVFKDMNDACKNLGFNLLEDRRIKSAISFLLRTTEPIGSNNRKILPMGDTHPPGPDFETLNRFAIEIGVEEDPKNWKTEEFPGFGIVFRNNPGTEKETFFAFKSGPTRGHYHGDQLSFHYCAYNKRIAIDHMCSYAPRADQEHMHNRVFFSLSDWKYTNLDGYERIIGFKTSKDVDIGIGQVENNRLRYMPKTPDEIVWQAKYPIKFFDKPIVYRRYVIFIKSEKDEICDYFVIWDRFNIPSNEIIPTFSIHVETPDDFINEKNCFKFNEKLTLFLVYPFSFNFERFNWGFEKRKDGKIFYKEETKGLFIRPSEKNLNEFITVLYPSDKNIPEVEFNMNEKKLTLKFKNSTEQIIFGNDNLKSKDNTRELVIIVKRNEKEIMKLFSNEIDLERNQGEGFYPVLEAGYNFGEIPDFLKKYMDFISAEEFYKLKGGKK